MIERRKIKYGERYARINRDHAVRDIEDALVEIITNCDDSYHRLSRGGGDILVTIERHRGNTPSLIVVRDRAEGMTLVSMDKKLGDVGERTAGKGDRGFMARGLRDCLSLGDIKVESIVDGRYYACELLKKTGEFNPLTKDGGRKADAELRKRMGIKKNGTMITLHCRNVSLPKFDSLVDRLSQHYALRDIVSRDKGGKIQVQEGADNKKTLAFPDLRGTQVLDESFKIATYPDAEARLRIWKADAALRDIAFPRMRQSGILIVGGRAVHQCTLLKYDNDDHALFYYGRLDCGHIERLLNDYEETDPDERPETNPSILVDPNRRTGLDKGHPFTVKLFAEINQRLKKLIDEDKAKATRKQGDITSAEMRKRLNNLAKFADKFLKEHVDEALPGDKEAVGDARRDGVYIKPPVFNIGAGGVRALTVYVSKDHYDPKWKTGVHSNNENAIKVVETFSGDSLRQHRRHADIFTGSFKVRGGKVGETADIVVRPSKHSSATTRGTVVSGFDENWRDFLHPLEFERKEYHIPEGKSKSVKLFADMSKMTGRDMVAYVSCPADKGGALSIASGGQCRLTPRQGTNYAEGEIQIKGRGVTSRALKVCARLGDFDASTKVRVVASKALGGKFAFQIVDDELGLGESRAEWDVENNSDLLLIAGTHPSISRYFGSPAEKFPRQNEAPARAILAEIITDSICMRVLQEEMSQRGGDFDYANDEPHDVLRKIRRNLRGKIHKFSVQAHKILFGDG